MSLRAFLVPTLAACSLSTASAQAVVSLKAGLLTYAEGRLQSGGVLLGARQGAFHLKPNHTLETRRGRAELLLGPAVFLRLAEDSAVTMENDNLTEARVRLERGVAIVEAVEILKGNLVRVGIGGAVAEIRQPGIYRFDAGKGEVRVYDGKLVLMRESATVPVKRGRSLALAGDAKTVSFDRDDIDRLQRWSARRSVAVAQSNLVSARTTHGFGWRRIARSWIFSLYSNGPTARSRPAPAPSGY